MENNFNDIKSLILFWIRLIMWVGVSCITPVAVFSKKFGLFEEASYEPVYDELGNIVNASPPALNGWGILSCIIVGFTILTILKEVSKAYVGYSFTKQIIKGICSAVPIAICFALCYFLEDNIETLKYCFAVLLITKLIAIPLNPLPKWRYEKSGVENYNDFIKTMSEYIKTLRKGV